MNNLVWKDIENQAMVAVSRDLTRQGCNAIPNYSLGFSFGHN